MLRFSPLPAFIFRQPYAHKHERRTAILRYCYYVDADGARRLMIFRARYYASQHTATHTDYCYDIIHTENAERHQARIRYSRLFDCYHTNIIAAALLLPCCRRLLMPPCRFTLRLPLRAYYAAQYAID